MVGLFLVYQAILLKPLPHYKHFAVVNKKNGCFVITEIDDGEQRIIDYSFAEIGAHPVIPELLTGTVVPAAMRSSALSRLLQRRFAQMYFDILNIDSSLHLYYNSNTK